MGIFDKITMPLSFGKPNKFHLQHNIVNTQDFGFLTPLLCREMIAHDSFNVRSQSFCRCSPLIVPTFADVNLDTHAFFVPLRQLWKDGEAFFTQSKYYDVEFGGSYDGAIPKINLSAIVRNWEAAGMSEVATEGKADYVKSITSGAGSSSALMRHTNKGKRVLNIFYALGYRLNFADHHTQSPTDDIWVSALPLLAYLHIYHEYYVPPIFYPNTTIQSYLGRSSKWWNQLTGGGQDAAYQGLLNAIRYTTYLEQDYFTASWQSPVGYYNNSTTFLRFPTSDSTSQTINTSTTSYPTVNGANLSDIAVKSLRAVTNLIMRNSLSGNKFVDRFLARYGVKLSSLTLQRPVFLGSSTQRLQVSDVMCNADTETGTVGDYAGKATSYGKGDFSYSSDEPGYFMVFSVIQPRAHLVQGMKREVMHTNLYDFFTPEYDKIGTQAIANREVFDEFNYPAIWEKFKKNQSPDGVFGFVPRYSEYKVGYDNCFGDFCLNSRNTGLDSFHLFRRLDESKMPTSLSLDESFLSSDPTTPYNNFGRIFSDSSFFVDNFILTHQIDITAYRPMATIADSLLPDTDNEHPKNVNLGSKFLS